MIDNKSLKIYNPERLLDMYESKVHDTIEKLENIFAVSLFEKS